MRRYRNICPKIPVSYRSLYGLPNGVLGDVNVTSPSTTSPAEFSFSTAAGFLPYQRTNEQATSQLHDHQARKPSSEVFHGAGSRCEADRNTHDRGTTSSTGDTSQAAKGSSRWSSHMVVPPPKATLTDTAWAILPEASETILIDPGSLEYPTSLPSPCRSNGMLSPMSTSSSYSNVAYLSSSDDSEPFDATEETERLMKIHDLAEKIVAREAASRGKVHVESPKNEDVVPSDNNFSASLTSLATSSLMPLAVAAGTSQRAPTARSPGASSGKSLIPSIDLSPSFHQSLGTAAAVPTAECKHTSTRSATISCCVRKETINCDGDKSAASTLPVPEPLRTSVNGRGRRRKLATPTKSPRPDDPGFRGAVVRMQLEIVGGKPQLKLEHCFNHISRRRISRHTGGHDHAELSESDDGQEFTRRESSQSGKQCASCSTRLTPLWRDAEDGTPLCNACGIRYKKYKVHCIRCWHIPRKNENTRSQCNECGATLRFGFRRSNP